MSRSLWRGGLLVLVLAAGGWAVWTFWIREAPRAPEPAREVALPRVSSVDLTEKQAESVKVGAVERHEFPVQRNAVGSIDFNGDLTLPVFSPYQGRIVDLNVKIGDDVVKGQALYTIDSPDLVQAASNLISTAGILELTTRSLNRLRDLAQTRAAAQKDYEQAISDQQAAEANHKAAKDAVRIFGKSEQDIDRMVRERRVDSILVIPSPIAGRITSRNAAPGLFIQPGTAPAPYSVADVSTMWMLANVHESESPYFKIGQQVKASVMAFPNRVFEGRVTTLGATIDPNTHRVLVRSEIPDPNHDLRPGMFATFTISVGEPVQNLGVPVNALVREGDGSMTVWKTTNGRKFEQQIVRTGAQFGGFVEIIDGLMLGEQIATDGALFLSNLVATGPKS